jgi:hypothetical protein
VGAAHHRGTRVEDLASLNRNLGDRDLDAGVRLTVVSGGSQRFVFLETDS